MKRLLRNLFLVLYLLAGSALSARAQIGALGVMGDSLSDEYFEETYGAYAINWVPQLVAYRGINVGPTASTAGQPGGTWGTPRRTGYQFDWAYSGDTSADLLTHGQHTGLAAQIVPNGITHAVLAVGANDFNPDLFSYPSSAYFPIYNGSWTQTQINNFIAQLLTNIETALATVATTGVRVVVFNILDYGKTPAVYGNFLYTNGTKRERVATAISQANTGLADLAQKYQVPLVDAFGLQKMIFGANTSQLTTLTIGSVAIHLQQSDTDPINNPNRAAAFVADKAHPHTTIQGLFANMALEAFRLGYGDDVPNFTEQEILAHAGLASGGSDTLTAEIGPYTDYLITPIKPHIAGINFVNGTFQLQFTTASNQLYRVESTSSLVTPTWSAVTNNLLGTGHPALVTDSTSAGHPSRFYRVRQLP